MLTKEGANAFLKTLEEPPPHAVFILATTEPERLPVTILSRCQRYAFRRIAVPVMIEKMKEIAKAEQIAVNDEALAAIAYRADGGLRDALTMLEQLAAFSEGKPATVATLDLAFGSTGRKFTAALLDAIVAKDATAALRCGRRGKRCRSRPPRHDSVADRRLSQSFGGAHRPEPARARSGRRGRRAGRPPSAERVAGDAAARAADFRRSALARARRRQRAARTGNGAAAFHPCERGSDARGAWPRASLPWKSGRLRRRAIPAVQPASCQERSEPASGTERLGRRLSLQRVRAAWQSIRGKVESERQSLRAPLSRAVIECVGKQRHRPQTAR